MDRKSLRNKLRAATLFILCFMLLSACSSLPDRPHHVGHVVSVDVDEKRILVISALTDEEVGELSLEELIELDKERGSSAVWYTGGGINYEIGDRVRIWIRGAIDDSYPGVAEAQKVEKYEVQALEKWW